MNPKILLIEDDVSLGECLKDFLTDNGLDTILSLDGMDAVDICLSDHIDLIVSDVILPEKDGFEILKDLREAGIQVPFFFMTGSEFNVDSQVKGYNAGAIYYLPKPVNLKVLLAQIKNQIKIANTKSYKIKEHIITIDQQLIMIDYKQVVLRDKESQVMQLLLDNIDKIVSRNTIMLAVWGSDDHKNNVILDNSVSRLKKAIKKYPKIKIRPVYGSGYILEG